MIRRTGFFAIVFFISVHLQAQDSLLQSLKKHVYILASDSMEGRGEGTLGILKAREYIIGEFKNAGLQPYGGQYAYDFSFRAGVVNVRSQNLVAFIEGSDPVLKEEYLVIGAHYDHIGWKEKDGEKIIYNGADDNASGTAMVIELAKLLNSHRELLKRSVVLVAFGAEESGLIGSENFVGQNIVPLSKIKCMFSLDMVGMYEKNKGVKLGGIETMALNGNLVDSVVKKTGIMVTESTDDIGDRTDTKPFGDKGIPAVYVNTGLKSPYHKPEDDSDLLDYEGMKTITGFMYELTLALSNTQSIEPIRSLSVQAEKTRYFGITPAFRLGSGLSSYKYPDRFYNAKSMFSYDAGFSAYVSLSKHFAIQPEVIFATSGSKSAEGKMRTQQVVVPAHILIGINNASQGNFYLMFGGYYKYFLSGKNGGSEVNYSLDYNRTQYGISYGIGCYINRIQVNILGQNALTEIYSEPSPENIYERGFTVNLAYRFK